MATRRHLGIWLNQGLTLVELLVVIAIIAVIGSYVIGAGQSSSQAASAARATAELTVLRAALEAYKGVHGDYPRTADSAVLLQALIGRAGPTGAAIARRPVLELAHLKISDDSDPFATTTACVVDPWSQPYLYAYKSSATWTQPGYVVLSGGPDRTSAPLLSGGFIDEAALENRDNIHLER